MIKPHHSREEVVRLGEAAFERGIAPRVRGQNLRHFVAIDVNTGAYEVDSESGVAIHRLLDREPGTQFWLRRIGSPIAHSFGPRIHFEPPPSV